MGNGHQSYWSTNTTKKVALLTELWESPAQPSASIIAEALFDRFHERTSRSSVLAKASRLGLSERPQPVNIANRRKKRIARASPAARAATRPPKVTVVVIEKKPSEPEPLTVVTRPRKVKGNLDYERGCQFIEGKPSRIDSKCKCGAPRLVGTSYCAAHYSRCYQARTDREVRRKAQQKHQFIYGGA